MCQNLCRELCPKEKKQNKKKPSSSSSTVSPPPQPFCLHRGEFQLQPELLKSNFFELALPLNSRTDLVPTVHDLPVNFHT